MRLLNALLIPILVTLGAPFAQAEDLGSTLKEILEKRPTAEAEIKQTLNKIAQLGEAQATAIMVKTFPPAKFVVSDYSQTATLVTLLSALAQNGSEEFSGFLIQILEKAKTNPKAHLKNLAILALAMKAGNQNVARFKDYINAYRKTQSDAETLRIIGIFFETIDSANTKIDPAPAPAVIDIPARVKEMSERIRTSWYQCPAKIWPHNKKPQVIFLDDKEKKAWLANENGLRLLNAVPEELENPTKFDLIEFENRRTTAINLRETFDDDSSYKGSYALYLAFHEGFHQMFQKDDWVEQDSFQRGDHYPSEFKPRYYRRMIFENLKRALMEPASSTQSVTKAAFWYRKWTSEFAGEIPQAVDRGEGVAMFHDVTAVALGHVGCQSDKTAITNFIRSNFDMFFQTPTGFDDEGYNVGALATLQLWLTNPNDWQKAIIAGRSPLELLFKAVQPTEDADDSNIIAQAKARSLETNREIKENLHGDLENFSSRDFVRVAIGRDWYSGTLPRRVMVLPRNYPDGFIFVTGKGYQTTGDSGFVKALGPLPLFRGFNNPCGDKGAEFIMVPASQVASGNGQYRGQSAYAEFELIGEEKTLNGLKWLCPKNNR